MSPFEMIMLIAFGSAWPVSIYKSAKSRTAKGKSLGFLVIIFLGYVSGTLHKIFYNMDWVIVLYILNGLMVGTDVLLTVRNRKLDRMT